MNMNVPRVPSYKSTCRFRTHRGSSRCHPNTTSSLRSCPPWGPPSGGNEGCWRRRQRPLSLSHTRAPVNCFPAKCVLGERSEIEGEPPAPRSSPICQYWTFLRHMKRKRKEGREFPPAPFNALFLQMERVEAEEEVRR